jgi:DNA-binding XRE family transcriptional regulator
MDSFETLPVHPHPKPLESLCSYLTRLVEVNRMGSAGRLFRLIFPDRKHNTDCISDRPPVSVKELSEMVVCSEQRLLATTFYYLNHRLISRTQSVDFGSFLSTDVTRYQRYCPFCLAEHGYYFLPWRFSMLPGCPQHRCRLLDQCGHCGAVIPLFATPPRLARCPSCEGYLDTCTTEPLSEHEWLLAYVHFYDLVALLSMPAEDEVYLPAQLSAERKKQGVTVAAMARWLGLRQVSVKAMENSTGRKPAFHYFVDYATVLSLTLRDLFSLPPPDPNWSQHVAYVTAWHKNWLAQQAEVREAEC